MTVSLIGTNNDYINMAFEIAARHHLSHFCVSSVSGNLEKARHFAKFRSHSNFTYEEFQLKLFCMTAFEL